MKLLYHTTIRGNSMGVPDDANVSDYPDYQETEPTWTPTEDAVRAERDFCLAQTDFYAMSDVTMPEDIREYRQSLRDVPQQDGFPASVTWPALPE